MSALAARSGDQRLRTPGVLQCGDHTTGQKHHSPHVQIDLNRWLPRAFSGDLLV